MQVAPAPFGTKIQLISLWVPAPVPGPGGLKKNNYLRSALRLRPWCETGREMNLNYSSKLLENAVAEFARLQGIGPKTALRMVLFMLRQEPEDVHRFSDALLQLKDGIKYCECCH